MTKNVVKKSIGKKNLKIEKKASKPAVAKVVLHGAKSAKHENPAKLVKKTDKVEKIEKVEKAGKFEKQERAVKKEAEVKSPSLLSKIAGKIFKAESKQKEIEARSGPKASKETDMPSKQKEAKKAKEPKIIKDEIVQVDVVAPAEKLKKQTKKAQAAYQAATEEEAKWLELKEKYKGIHPSPYRMSEIYQEKTLLDHKVLGLGVILSVINDRLEVLFQTGTKHLISNYKK